MKALWVFVIFLGGALALADVSSAQSNGLSGAGIAGIILVLLGIMCFPRGKKKQPEVQQAQEAAPKKQQKTSLEITLVNGRSKEEFPKDDRPYQKIFSDAYNGLAWNELIDSGIEKKQITKFLKLMDAENHQPKDKAHYCNPQTTAEFCPPDFVWYRLKIVDGICAREGFPSPEVTSSSPASKQWYAFLRFVNVSAANQADAFRLYQVDQNGMAVLHLSAVRKKDLPLIAFFQKTTGGFPPYFPGDGICMGTRPSIGGRDHSKSLVELDAELQGVVLEFPIKNHVYYPQKIMNS